MEVQSWSSHKLSGTEQLVLQLVKRSTTGLRPDGMPSPLSPGTQGGKGQADMRISTVRSNSCLLLLFSSFVTDSLMPIASSRMLSKLSPEAAVPLYYSQGCGEKGQNRDFKIRCGGELCKENKMKLFGAWIDFCISMGVRRPILFPASRRPRPVAHHLCSSSYPFLPL